MNKKDMRILLLGASGQVGSECKALFQQAGYTVFAITRKELDFSCVDSAGDLAKKLLGPELPCIVVNAMAYTAVDKAESEPDLADKINHLSVTYLSQYCAKYDIPLIHLSTDYVFDGTGVDPYLESSEVNPLGVYGKTKWLGEQVIESHLSRYIILRTSWVFGVHGNNFVKTILRLAEDRDTLPIVGDQYGCPTYAGDIAAVIVELIQKYTSDLTLDWGVYHCVGEGVVSWCEFSQVIVDEAYARGLLSRPPEIVSISTGAYPTPAARPAYSVLNTNKLSMLLGRQLLPWRTGLAAFFDSNSLSS